MKILILEDEQLTASRIIQLVNQYDSSIEVLSVLDSIDRATTWLSENSLPDLLLADINLSDGPVFDLFDRIQVNVPVIFITAYSEYAIKAFRVNSIDYLVKPLDYNELRRAFDKYKSMCGVQMKLDSALLNSIFKDEKPEYRKRFLAKLGDQFRFIQTDHVAYFKSEDGIAFAVTFENASLPLDLSLEDIHKQISPEQFFRISRKFIVNNESIRKIHTYFNNRLKLVLDPVSEDDVLVSRERVAGFKEWLNR